MAENDRLSIPISERKRKRKNNRRSSLIPRDITIYGGPATRTTSGVTATFVNQMTARSKLYDIIALQGNYRDPTRHQWRTHRQDYPAGTLVLDPGTVDETTWTGYHTFFDGAYPDFFTWTGETSEKLFGWEHYNLSEKVARSRFYRNLRQSELDLAIDIAEINQTKKMLFRRIKQFLGMLFRRIPKGAPQETWSGILLEVQYGWRPLLGSIFGLIEHMRNWAKRFRVVGTYTKTDTQTIPWNGSLARGYSRRTVKSTCKIQVDLKTDNLALFELSRLASLNPLAWAWELLTLSFVADWFLDIGSFLQELEQSIGAGLLFERGFITHVHSARHSYTIPRGSVSQSGRNFKTTSIVEGVCRSNLLTRVPIYSLPLPSLPSFEPKLGWQRMLSAAALIHQRYPHRRS
jgi:hypothetical protein